MGPEDTAQLPVESARCVEKLATPCQEGTARGCIVWGLFGALLLGKETALHVSIVPNWTPWVRLEKIISTQPGPMALGHCAKYVDSFFLD